MAAFKGWESALLKAVKLPVTQQNITFLDSWQASEGGKATNNPLNTTQPVKGATDLAGNSAGVKNYPTTAAGIAATAKTLTNGHYGAIVAALRTGDPYAYTMKGGKAVVEPIASQLETWGSKGFALNFAYTQTGLPPANVVGDQQTEAVTNPVTGQTTTSQASGPQLPSWTGWITSNAGYAMTWVGLVLFAVVLGIFGLLKLLGVSPGGVLRDGTKTAEVAA